MFTFIVPIVMSHLVVRSLCAVTSHNYKTGSHISNLSFSVIRNHSRELRYAFCEKDLRTLHKVGVHQIVSGRWKDEQSLHLCVFFFF